ncbi:hypothetical protein CBL_08276 [Carabus blaptoides fortunei]
MAAVADGVGGCTTLGGTLPLWKSGFLPGNTTSCPGAPDGNCGGFSRYWTIGRSSEVSATENGSMLLKLYLPQCIECILHVWPWLLNNAIRQNSVAIVYSTRTHFLKEEFMLESLSSGTTTLTTNCYLISNSPANSSRVCRGVLKQLLYGTSAKGWC